MRRRYLNTTLGSINGSKTRPLGAEYEHHIQLFKQCLEWYGRFGVPNDEEERYAALSKTVAEMEEKLDSEEPLPLVHHCLPHGDSIPEKEVWIEFCPNGVVDLNYSKHPCPPMEKRFGGLGYELEGIWKERIRQLSVLSSHQRKTPQTVGHQVQRFLDFKEIQVRGGVLKARTWGTLAERLPAFVKWIKPGTHVATINGTTITDFYTWLLQQQNWGQQQRKGIFAVARQWIRWAWRQEDVEVENLPKNIDSREFVFLTHIDETGVTKKTRTELLWTP